jgi:hypothetical protein
MLQRHGRGHVIDVTGVRQGPYGDDDVRRVELFHRELVVAWLVDHAVDVVVFVDHHRRDVATPTVRQGQCGPLGDVDHGEAVQRVTIQPNDGLPINGGGFAVVEEPVHACGVALKVGEHSMGLGAYEIVDVHPHGS